MGMFEKNDAKFLAQLKNTHLRRLFLDRLIFRRKLGAFLLLVMSLVIVGNKLSGSNPDPWGIGVWVLFVMGFALADFQIKAVKYINETDIERAEQPLPHVHK